MNIVKAIAGGGLAFVSIFLFVESFNTVIAAYLKQPKGGVKLLPFLVFISICVFILMV